MIYLPSEAFPEIYRAGIYMVDNSRMACCLQEPSPDLSTTAHQSAKTASEIGILAASPGSAQGLLAVASTLSRAQELASCRFAEPGKTACMWVGVLSFTTTACRGKEWVGGFMLHNAQICASCSENRILERPKMKQYSPSYDGLNSYHEPLEICGNFQTFILFY